MNSGWGSHQVILVGGDSTMAISSQVILLMYTPKHGN